MADVLPLKINTTTGLHAEFGSGDKVPTANLNVGTGAGDVAAGNHTHTLTGDVTGSGSGSFSTTIAANAVTFAKMQAVSANILLGNDLSGTTVEEIPCTGAARALLDDPDNTTQRATLGLGTMATQNAGSVAITGGTISSITDLSVGDGGTGASDATNARANLGLVIGADIQPYYAGLTAIGVAASSAKGWRGHIFGLTLSNNVSDATNDIDIAAGSTWDNTNDVLLVLTSSYTKRLDANWAVGTNQGGLDTGSKANSTWYHVWLIRRSDTGVVDVLFSASATSPTMPTSYDGKRRIGTIYNNSSGVISPFTQVDDDFLLGTGVVATTTPSTGAANVTLRTPLGVRTKALVYLSVSATVAAKVLYAYAIAGELHEVHAATGNTDSRTLPIRTNTSSQIGYFTSHATDITISIVTYGWTDNRGQYS